MVYIIPVRISIRDLDSDTVNYFVEFIDSSLIARHYPFKK